MFGRRGVLSKLTLNICGPSCLVFPRFVGSGFFLCSGCIFVCFCSAGLAAAGDEFAYLSARERVLRSQVDRLVAVYAEQIQQGQAVDRQISCMEANIVRLELLEWDLETERNKLKELALR